MHKNTKLLPYQRRDIFDRWKMGTKVTHLAREYKVTRDTIYGTLKDAKLGIFENRKSMNERYRTLYWGLRRLSKTEKEIALKIAKRERRKIRYEKSIPGEMVHLDTKRLPLLRGEAVIQPREYLFVAIDDYSRWLYADIFPDKTSYSAAIMLTETMASMPFIVTGIYSDNGSEYKGKKGHPVRDMCERLRLSHGFTKVKHPWTNGKAERVIKTLMTEWCSKSAGFISRDHRRRYLYAYVNWYNQSRIHSSIGSSPLERLETFLARVRTETQSVRNA
jgi:transposase InsO family protein